MLLSLLRDDHTIRRFAGAEEVAVTMGPYILRLWDSDQLRDKLKASHYLPVIEAALLFKRSCLDTSEYFLTKLWRACHSVIRYGWATNMAAEFWRVEEEDVSLLCGTLDPKLFGVVASRAPYPQYVRDPETNKKKIAKKKPPVIERAPDEYRSSMMRKIQEKSALVVRRGSRKGKGGHSGLFFLARDGVDLDDLINILIMEGIRLFLRYEHLYWEGPGFASNTVFSGIANRGTGLIMEGTTRNRANLIREGQLKPAEGDTQTKREYKSLLVSLDQTNEEDVGLIEKIAADNGRTPEDEIRVSQIRRELCREDYSPSVKRFLDLVLGSGTMDFEFNRWLRTQKGGKWLKSCEDDQKTLMDCALEFLNLNLAVVRGALGHMREFA